MFRLKRIYELPAPDDGYRVLVERLWSRGISRDRAALAVWLKDLSPSPALRKWYGHDQAKWQEFRKRYRAELEANTEPVRELLERSRQGTVTLLFAAKDPEHSSAAVLKEWLEEESR